MEDGVRWRGSKNEGGGSLEGLIDHAGRAKGLCNLGSAPRNASCT